MNGYLYNIKIIKNERGYLENVFNLDNLEKNEILFGFLCEEGLINEAKWVLENDKRINIHTHDEFPFRMACKGKQFDCILWLHEYSKQVKSPINYNVYDDYIFIKFCGHGLLSLAKWVMGISKVNIHAQKEGAFRKACKHGQLKIIKWLLHKTKIKISQRDNYAIKRVCIGGHLDILIYILSKYTFDIHFENDKLFMLACENGQLSVAKYLYDYNGKINITMYIHYPFRMACVNNHYNVASWLKTLNDKYDFKIIDGKIMDFIYN